MAQQIDREELERIRQNRTAARAQDNRSTFNWWLTNLMRLGFLGVVALVLLGTWLVSSAHLREQFLGVPKQAEGLIDLNSGESALNPDNIEKQILSLNLRMREQDLTRSVSDNARPRPFKVNLGEPARFVAARLESEGFVVDGELFNLYVRVNDLAQRIEAGNFMLAETMTIPEVAEALQSALFEEILVTVPEGFRVEEIADRLSENNVMEPDIFLAAVRAPRSLALFDDYDFLQNLPEGGSLEGFLFPDTYRFPVLASDPELILRSFLNNFEAKVGADGLLGGNSGLAGRDLITLASIVEREAVQADERPLIASVYINRLARACDADVGGAYLQADPTVQYARGTVGNWWWQPTSVEEYAEVINPYNTYLNPGLPPGPIASPGLSAIDSTRNPAQTNYCFFLGTGDDGRHVFATTLAEHENNLLIYGYQ